MAYVAKRFGGETYPEAPRAGGSPSSAAKPLTRQRWIDPLTTTAPANQNGAESTPYGSVPIFLASGSAGSPGPGVQPVSADDANTMFVGLVAPAPSDAFGSPTLTIPAYRNTEIGSLSDGVSFLSQGTLINNPTVVWANTLANGGPKAPNLASLVLRNQQYVEGSITISDDPVGAVPSVLVLLGSGAQDIYTSSFDETVIDASAATMFEYLVMQGTYFDGEEYAAPTAQLIADSSEVTLICNASVLPNVGPASLSDCSAVEMFSVNTADTFLFDGCTSVDIGATFTTASPNEATFLGCGVLSGTITPAVADQAGFVFDAASWRSWTANGGTFTDLCVSLVIGGYCGGDGAVPAPDGHITSATSAASLALNGAGATAPWTHGGNWYQVDSLADIGLTVSLLPGGAEPGDTICVTNYDTTGAFLTVQDATTGNLGGPVVTINNAGFVVAEWDGSQWVLQEVGQLQNAG